MNKRFVSELLVHKKKSKVKEPAEEYFLQVMQTNEYKDTVSQYYHSRKNYVFSDEKNSLLDKH